MRGAREGRSLSSRGFAETYRRVPTAGRGSDPAAVCDREGPGLRYERATARVADTRGDREGLGLRYERATARVADTGRPRGSPLRGRTESVGFTAPVSNAPHRSPAPCARSGCG